MHYTLACKKYVSLDPRMLRNSEVHLVKQNCFLSTLQNISVEEVNPRQCLEPCQKKPERNLDNSCTGKYAVENLAKISILTLRKPKAIAKKLCRQQSARPACTSG